MQCHAWFVATGFFQTIFRKVLLQYSYSSFCEVDIALQQEEKSPGIDTSGLTVQVTGTTHDSSHGRLVYN